jgi:hypothetical protein
MHIEIVLNITKDNWCLSDADDREWSAPEYATLESRLLRGWMLDNFISGKLSNMIYYS